MKLIDFWIRWKAIVRMMLDTRRIGIGSKGRLLEDIMGSRGDWHWYSTDLTCWFNWHPFLAFAVGICEVYAFTLKLLGIVDWKLHSFPVNFSSFFFSRFSMH